MSHKLESTIVGISIGDLNGIGAEVILKTFEDVRTLELCTPVLFANVKLLSFIRKQLKIEVSLHGIDSLDQIVVGKINVLNVWKEGVDIEFGKLNEEVGKYAIKSFVAAAKSLQEGTIDVLVTAPINKYAIQSDEFKFPGHTDYLAKTLEGNAVMFMVCQNLRVGLLTDHIPVNEVINYVTPQLLQTKLMAIHHTLVQDFRINKPKIAVLGLNPHCGDNGVIGKEDNEILMPTIQKMFDSGIMVFGPFPSDSFFGSESYKKYDAILAMYHDQGLIPFKTLSFGNGVNYTAGLNKIRTSPDHGTAFEIAGKGVANETSFREALYLALDVFVKRNEYQELTKSPLKTKQIKI